MSIQVIPHKAEIVALLKRIGHNAVKVLIMNVVALTVAVMWAATYDKSSDAAIWLYLAGLYAITVFDMTVSSK